MSLARWVEDYLAARHTDGLAASTLTNQRSHLVRFVAFLEQLGVRDVAELTREVIEDYLLELAWTPTSRGEPMKVETRNVRLCSIRSWCRWLCDVDAIAVDPASELGYAREPDPLPRNILSAPEVEQLLATPDPQTRLGYRDRVVMELLYSTAVRVSELVAFDVDDLDLELGYARVRCGKGGKGRVVPVGKLACELVHSYVAEIRPELLEPRGEVREPALILSRYGRRLARDGVASLIAKHAAAAGIGEHVTPHTFRHSCATHVLRGGASIRHIQEMLGHRKITSTEVYTRVTIDELKAVHARFHPRGTVEEPEVRPPRKEVPPESP